MDMLRNVAEARTVTVLRDGKETEIYMPEISLLDIAKEEPMFLDILRPNVVDSVICRRSVGDSRSAERGQHFSC